MTTAGPASAPPPSLPPRRRVRARHVVLLVLAGLALLALSESLWLRPLIRQVVLQRSGRAIDFSAIHLGLDRELRPRVGFDDLNVANAAWAASREPLIRGRRVVFEFDWQGLSTGVWQIRRLVLEDAAVDLERRADGLRNSRLLDPGRNGPPRTRVLRIDARRSQLRYADAVIGLQLQIASSPLAAPQPLAGRPEPSLTQRLRFEGRSGNTDFAGSADVGDFITLQRTGDAFPLQGEIRLENIHLRASGQVADVLAGGKFETDLQLAIAPQPGRRAAPFGAVPATLEMTGDGHLSRSADHWAVSALRLRTAHSEAVGTLDFRHGNAAGGRSMLRANLDAQRLDLHDIPKPATGTPAPGAAAESRPRALDAEIDLHVARLESNGRTLAREARLHTSLDHDRLGVRLADVGVAEGHASGEWRVDASRSPPASTLDLRLTGLRLDALPRRKPGGGPQAGRLDGQAALQAHGNSLGELLATASGRIEASLHGASVSKRLEAELGLDGLGLLRSLVGGSEQVPLRCAEFALDVQKGIGTVRRLAIDTPRTAVSGRGSIDLAQHRLDVVLSPASNVDALLALPRDIHVQGRLDAPTWALQARGASGAPHRCNAG